MAFVLLGYAVVGFMGLGLRGPAATGSPRSRPTTALHSGTGTGTAPRLTTSGNRLQRTPPRRRHIAFWGQTTRAIASRHAQRRRLDAAPGGVITLVVGADLLRHRRHRGWRHRPPGRRVLGTVLVIRSSAGQAVVGRTIVQPADGAQRRADRLPRGSGDPRLRRRSCFRTPPCSTRRCSLSRSWRAPSRGRWPRSGSTRARRSCTWSRSASHEHVVHEDRVKKGCEIPFEKGKPIRPHAYGGTVRARGGGRSRRTTPGRMSDSAWANSQSTDHGALLLYTGLGPGWCRATCRCRATVVAPV